MRSNLLWASFLAIAIVGAALLITLPGEEQPGSAGTKLSKEQPKGKSTAAPSKSSRRLDMATVEERDGLLYGAGEDQPFTGTLEDEHPGGGRKARIPVRNGRIDGTMRIFDENGTLRTRAEYEDGQLSDKREWDRDGEAVTASDQDPFTDLLAARDAARQGPSAGASWPQPLPGAVDPSEGVEVGNLQERGGIAYLADTREPYTGRALRRMDDGSRWERNYLNGVRHGEFKYYFPNGQLQSQETYVDGKKDGLYTMWFENGQKRYEAEINNGRQIGIATSWNQEGEVISRWEYTEDGQRINLLAPPPPTEETDSPPDE